MTAAPPIIGCVVLAAGAGSRFGSDKRVAQFGANTLIAHTLATVAPLFSRRILVLRAGDEDLGAHFANDWQLVFAEDAGKGMGHSLAAAMPACSGWDGVVVALADMPFVQAATIAAVRDALGPGNIVVPYYRAQRGNPVGLGKRYFTELMRLRGDQGARVLLQQHATAVHRLDVEDPGILRDVDTPAALAGQAD